MNRIWLLHINQNNPIEQGWGQNWSKYHAFIDNKAICGEYSQDTNFIETGITESEIIKNPGIACKKCLAKIDVL
ncbi:hypothetical protein [Bacillus pumilus]|uniref:hypothetical protein n=1 Tax=Bacillus pumilus TaxID=1408 RepID=UPI0011E90778|nr:hypothetical protein [Bacillus pumilus]TYS40523.1 hypothetical protein FZC68_17100 [Bacillus pumilus]